MKSRESDGMDSSSREKVYRQGSPLSLAGAQFRVAFEGDWPAERVNTTNPAVTVRDLIRKN